MNNAIPVIPEGNTVPLCSPPCTQFSTSSQNLQTKTCNDDNNEENKETSSSLQASPSDQNQLTNNLNFVDNLATCLQVKNNEGVVTSDSKLVTCPQVNNEVVTVDCNTSTFKKKNSKKRHRKQLQLAAGTNGVPMHNQPNQSPNPLNTSVHNFFASHSAVYANSCPNGAVYTSPRTMNNLSHHPQLQFMQNMQNLQNAVEIHQVFQSMSLQNSHAASMPSTPIVHPHQRPGSASIPCSPMLTPQTNIQFFQNVTQHPLLCRSLNVPQNFNVSVPVQNVNASQPKNSPRNKNNKNNEVKSEDRKFENYLSAEDVAEGLKNGTLFEGVLRINPKQFQQGFISTCDRDEQDVFIDGIKNRNRALEGDVVVVQLIEVKTEDGVEEDVEKKQKRGKVVYITEKVHTRTAIGNLKLMPDKNRQRALFVPRDHRIPRLNIPFTCWPDNFYQDAKSYEDTLFLAKIVDWFDTRFAIGKILANIGQSGDMQTETKAILAQNDLDVTPFGSDIRHLFPRLDYTIPEEEIKIREDCRKQCIYSIDPSNCRDIDDAVSCRELDDGNYEVGVHISDVAHYLTENTVLDEKVAKKATTIYLVEKAFHMLPDELCMLCSLFPGVDKLAFSVFWVITPDGEVLSHRFAKTVINSCAQLSYDHAQAILEEKDDAETIFPETYNGFQFKEISKSIKILGGMAAKFRKNRFENGALRIDQPKVSFHLNPSNGLPESYWIYKIRESNQMIEEFMLLANMTVANRIYEDHPKLAFLRCHPRPSGYMLRQLAKSLEPLGISLDIESAGQLHRSLLPHTESEGADIGKAMVLNMLCAKPMTRAKYFCAAGCEDEDFHHYALNVPLYTHFTSPIRRYADIMVHRLLAASLKYRPTPEWEVDNVRMVAAQCNKQKYNAKRAGEMSSEFYMLKYVEMHSPVETEAVVVEVREKYIDVIIPAMGLNRRIFFNNDFPGEFNCVKHEGGSSKMSKMEIKWRAEDGNREVEQVIETFSILKVHMHKGDEMVKVETKLIRPQ